MKINETCKIKGCTRLIKSKKHNLCTPHLYQYYRKGIVKPGRVRGYKPHKPFHKED